MIKEEQTIEGWSDYTKFADHGSDEWATSDRGWLVLDDKAVANYLDYGSKHYRSPHEYCSPGRPCRDCQPGNVHACYYGPNGPRCSSYFMTVADAKAWLESKALGPHGQLSLNWTKVNS